MAKGKKKKKNAGPPEALVRLSQCMIAKNEERNIESALSWAKNVAFEQIVVDTGSTDRTVEIAEKMGAKVYNFEWCDDFSAAKNFAIEKASGNWIAFLDADEYFSPIDAKKLMIFLRRIMKDPHMKANYHVINCRLDNVDDEGKLISSIDQDRIFRNLPQCRYSGRVHERFNIPLENVVSVDEIKIIHTGYSRSEHEQTNKSSRNVELSRLELAENPNDLNQKAFLADSLKLSDDKNEQKEADTLFSEVIAGWNTVFPDLLAKAYLFKIKKIIDDPTKEAECKLLFLEACSRVPGHADLMRVKELFDSGAAHIPTSDQPPTPQSDKIRLSQVMITKNEEATIEKALSWAKNIAFEQIVVDTGSTDRTVEIAEELGAKVYQFKWIDDFAAAKNFAMDKATGNWIAILDADEYFHDEDIPKLAEVFKKIENSPGGIEKYDGIDCSLLNLKDDGSVSSVFTQARIFRNAPELRYKGKIHEAVYTGRDIYDATNLRIIHTGYAKSVYDQKGKDNRNLELLRREYEADPHNPATMIYLADLLRSQPSKEERDEALSMFHKALDSKEFIFPKIKQAAYDYLLRYHYVTISNGNLSELDKALKICDAAVADLPEIIDYHYYRGALLNIKQEYSKALKDLQICGSAFVSPDKLPESRVLVPNILPLYFQLRLSADGIQNEDLFAKYNEIVQKLLIDGKNTPGVAGSFMVDLFTAGATEDEVLAELSCAYDMSSPKDLLHLAREAKNVAAIGFAQSLVKMAGEVMGK